MALRARQRQAIWERDNYTCRYCGMQIIRLREWHSWAKRWVGLIHTDHIVPRSKGGSDHPDNLVTACRDCNLAKYDHVWEPIPLAESQS